MTIVDPEPQRHDRNAKGRTADVNTSVSDRWFRSCRRGFLPIIRVSLIHSGTLVDGCDWAGLAN